MPACFALAWLALPLCATRGRLSAAGRRCRGLLAVVLERSPRRRPRRTSRKFAAMTLIGWLVPELLRGRSRWVVAGGARSSPGSTPTRSGAARRRRSSSHHAAVFTALSFAFVVPGGDAARPRAPRRVLLRALPRRERALRAARRLATWLALIAALGVTIVAHDRGGTSNGLPALPGISLGFLLPNADLIWRAYDGSPVPVTART